MLIAGAAATGIIAGRGAGAAAGRGGAAAAGAAAPVRGAGACAGAAVPIVGAGAAVGPPVGPPGGRGGNLMVGAAEGLGGKLIRTVSFFGWTLPVSFFGGTAPPGGFGMFSAISFLCLKLELHLASVNRLNESQFLWAHFKALPFLFSTR